MAWAEAMATWRRFLETYASIVGALEADLEREHGLPLSWYDVLVQLHEAGEQRLRMQDLARAVLISRSGLTRLVDRMTAAGLAGREPCADDRRGTFVVLTAKGTETLRRAAPTHLRGIERYFLSRLAEDDLQALDTALQRLLLGQQP